MQAVLARIDVVNPVGKRLRHGGARIRAGCGPPGHPAAGPKGHARCPPLHGVPVSIKDLYATKGIRTTWGSLIYKDHVPSEDDLVVQRLKAAGAIVVGKTNTPEFGAGGNTFNAVFGATRNPWNPALTCGGSSGGAAVAVATGMGPHCPGLGPRWLAPRAGSLLRGRRLPHDAGPDPVTSAGARLGHSRRHRADRAHGRATSRSCCRRWPAPRSGPALLRGRHEPSSPVR